MQFEAPKNQVPANTANTHSSKKMIHLRAEWSALTTATQPQNSKAGSKGDHFHVTSHPDGNSLRDRGVSVLRQTQQCQTTPTFRVQALEPDFCFPPTLHLLHPEFLVGVGVHSPYSIVKEHLYYHGQVEKSNYCSASPKCDWMRSTSCRIFFLKKHRSLFLPVVLNISVQALWSKVNSMQVQKAWHRSCWLKLVINDNLSLTTYNFLKARINQASLVKYNTMKIQKICRRVTCIS